MVSDELLLEAMKIPAKLRMGLWAEALRTHERHPSFRIADNPIKLEVGFQCECQGTPEVWRLSVRDLKSHLPEARETLERLGRRRTLESNRRRVLLQKGEKRAKALLFRYLTKVQKITLRANAYFDTVGADKQTYRIFRRDKIQLLNSEGKAVFHYCIHPYNEEGEGFPSYDVMLAQKVLLENDLEFFLKTAHATPIPRPELEPSSEPPVWAQVSDEDLEDIAGWASLQLTATN